MAEEMAGRRIDGTAPAADSRVDADFPDEQLTLPEGVPPLPEGDFSRADHWAWANIVTTGIADFFNHFAPDDEDAAFEAYTRRYRTGTGARRTPPGEPAFTADGEPAGSEDTDNDQDEDLDTVWAGRTLSDDFLNTILCREPWRSAIPFSQIDITGARLRIHFDRPVQHGIILDKCLLSDSIAAFGCQFERNVLVRDSTVFGLINFGDTQFGQTLRLVGIWANQIDLSDARIEGALWVSDCVFESECDFIGARISGLVTFAGSAFHGNVDADRIDIGGSLLLRDMAHLGRLDCVNASIAGSLDISGSQFTDLIDFTGVSIGRELRLSSREHKPPVWGDKAQLILRNAETVALQSGLEGIRKAGSRPRGRLRKKDVVPTDLSGFRFEIMGGRFASGSDTLLDAPASSIVCWIESMPGFHDRYTPAPYRRFSTVLRAAGHVDKAGDLMVAKSRHRLRSRNTGLPTKLTLWIGGILSGFGQRNHRAVLWFVLVVLSGMFAGLWAEGWRPDAGMPKLPPSWDDWLRASIDNAAPIIEFQNGSAAEPADLLQQSPPGWFQGLWFSLAFLGFVVLSYLLAGISGVFDRGED